MRRVKGLWRQSFFFLEGGKWGKGGIGGKSFCVAELRCVVDQECCRGHARAKRGEDEEGEGALETVIFFFWGGGIGG